MQKIEKVRISQQMQLEEKRKRHQEKERRIQENLEKAKQKKEEIILKLKERHDISFQKASVNKSEIEVEKEQQMQNQLKKKEQRIQGEEERKKKNFIIQKRIAMKTKIKLEENHLISLRLANAERAKVNDNCQLYDFRIQELRARERFNIIRQEKLEKQRKDLQLSITGGDSVHSTVKSGGNENHLQSIATEYGFDFEELKQEAFKKLKKKSSSNSKPLPPLTSTSEEHV